MNIKYVTNNYNPSPKLKEILEKKINKLEKYFNSDVDVKVNLSQQNKMYKMEITINAKGSFFRSEVLSDDMFANIDLALPKIEKQVLKYGDKFNAKFKKDAFLLPDLMFLNEKPEKTPSKIVKTKTFELEPTDVLDAVAQMEALDHNFYVFLNAETNKVNVVYKRNDNNFGLIDLIY
jgi:putative sigma-54 modulation protein